MASSVKSKLCGKEGGADKLCQALFKNTGGFCIWFPPFASSDATNPFVYLHVSRVLYLFYFCPLLLRRPPFFQTRKSQVTFLALPVFFKQYVSATCEWTTRKFREVYLFLLSLILVLKKKVALCDVAKINQMNPILPFTLAWSTFKDGPNAPDFYCRLQTEAFSHCFS